MNYENEGKAANKVISMDEAVAYIDGKKRSSSSIANATFLCIISPLLLIVLGTMAEDAVCGVTEQLASIIGLVFLFGVIAIAVFIFITCGIRMASMEHIEKDSFELASGVADMVGSKKTEYNPVFATRIAAGVVLCIVSVVPLVVAGIMEAPDYVCGILVGLMLLIVGIGVNIMIRAGMIMAGYSALLQEGEYTAAQKQKKEKTGAISGAYWCIVTAIYLAWSFITNQWDITWIVWPVAGVLYAAFSCVMKVLEKTE